MSTRKERLRRDHPALYERLRRLRRAPHRLVDETTARALFGDEPTVRSGPFAGMRYVRESHGSTLLPKIAGTYERELHGSLESLVRSGVGCFVDVGSAEGYYSVGMALRLPHARIVAWEIEEPARRAAEELASRNGVASRIEQRAGCDGEALERLLEDLSGTPTFVLIDVEGRELDLLAPALPAVSAVELLVEIHEFMSPGIGIQVERLLQTSHEIAVIPTEPRVAEPGSALWAPLARRVVDEKRPPGMYWLHCVPRLRPAGPVESAATREREDSLS